MCDAKVCKTDADCTGKPSKCDTTTGTCVIPMKSGDMEKPDGHLKHKTCADAQDCSAWETCIDG